MKAKIVFLIIYLFSYNCAFAQVESDPLAMEPLDQPGSGKGNFTVSNFSARKAEADVLKGHYRTRYVGRKNRILAEKEESEYEAQSYSTPDEFTENTLDPSVVSSVKNRQVLSMLASGAGQKLGMAHGLNTPGLMTGMNMATSTGASPIGGARIGIGQTDGLGMRKGVAAVGSIGAGSGATMTAIQNQVSRATDASDGLLQSDVAGSTPGKGMASSQGFLGLGQ